MNRILWMLVTILSLGCCSCGLITVNESYGLHVRLMNEKRPIQKAEVRIEGLGDVRFLKTDSNGYIRISRSSSTRVSWLGGPAQFDLMEQHILINATGYKQVSINYYKALPGQTTVINGRPVEEVNGVLMIGNLELERLK